MRPHHRVGGAKGQSCTSIIAHSNYFYHEDLFVESSSLLQGIIGCKGGLKLESLRFESQ